MTAANKIKYGLKNVHYAVVTESGGVVTYGTPVKIPGAVSLSLSPEGEESTYYADDTSYFSTFANNGYSGDIELALIPDQFRIDVLGDIKDTNGVLFEDANAISKNIALMFEFSGDKKITRHVLYNATVARPNIEGETKQATIDPKGETLSIKASSAIDTGYPKAKCQTGDAAYETWYDAVYIKDTVIA